MKGIYFEEKGPQLLERLGMTKSEFARRMGIQRQNVNVLFRTNNLEIIARAAEVLNVPLSLLIGNVQEPIVLCDSIEEMHPEDIPTGDSAEDRRKRNHLIRNFYFQWMQKNEERKVFNKSINDDIYVKYISINETAGHASLRYLSTLAVMQLDSILPNAVLKESRPANPKTKNQKGFNRILIMEYFCPGIGLVRMTVGQKKTDGSKVQYCITAISAE